MGDRHRRDRHGSSEQDERSHYERREKRGLRMLSVLRRKAGVAPWVGLLASRWQRLLPGRFTFPSVALSGLRSDAPSLQWRNRAGLAPDFPVMPVVGTQGDWSYIRN